MTDDSNPFPEQATFTREYVLSNAIPITELEELADEWKDSPTMIDSECAQELRELIQDYE